MRRYISDVVKILVEAALEAREIRDSSPSNSEKRAFEGGRAFGIFQALSFMTDEARAFEISLREIGLNNIDAEAELGR